MAQHKTPRKYTYANPQATRNIVARTDITVTEVRAWQASRKYAEKKNIPFHLCLFQWVYWWRYELAKIGPHARRGKTKSGYAMQLLNRDIGYKLDNIACVPNSQQKGSHIFESPADDATAAYEISCDTSITKTEIDKWTAQRYHSLTRNIPFRLSLATWVYWWRTELAKKESNASRGREQDQYLMGRIGDTGAYEIGNIKCITAYQNSIDRWYNTKIVITPLGEFITFHEAAVAHNTSYQTIQYRVRRKKKGYFLRDQSSSIS